jgi:hypothetical protein
MPFRWLLIMFAGAIVATGAVAVRRAVNGASSASSSKVDEPAPKEDSRFLNAPSSANRRPRSRAPAPFFAASTPEPATRTEAAARRPVSRRELVTGVNEGKEPKYLALVSAATEYLPELTEAQKSTLLAVARKRVRLTLASLKQHPDTGEEPAMADSDDLVGAERTLLGEDLYTDYRSALEDVLNRAARETPRP